MLWHYTILMMSMVETMNMWEKKEAEKIDACYVTDEAMTTAVYEDDDEFLKFWNFLIPFVSNLLLEHKMAKSWMTLYLKNARLMSRITKKV